MTLQNGSQAFPQDIAPALAWVRDAWFETSFVVS
jgi:hypothetical protein